MIYGLRQVCALWRCRAKSGRRGIAQRDNLRWVETPTLPYLPVPPITPNGVLGERSLMAFRRISRSWLLSIRFFQFIFQHNNSNYNGKPATRTPPAFSLCFVPACPHSPQARHLLFIRLLIYKLSQLQLIMTNYSGASAHMPRSAF